MFTFNFEWDLWDSYTWWWIYFLLFAWIGGKVVPNHLRKPIAGESFRYGGWSWIVLINSNLNYFFSWFQYLGKITG